MNENLFINLGQDDGNIESIICNPITVSGVGKTKLLKGLEKSDQKSQGFFDIGKQNIELHFDMHHGFGNLYKAINLLEDTDKKFFRICKK